MKKFIYIILATMLCLVSCNKSNGSLGPSQATSNKFLPGTTWVDSEGNTLSFTKTTVSLNGSSTTYTVTMEAESTGTIFTVDNLKSGGKTYVSGVASSVKKALYLAEYGSIGQAHFILK